MSESFADNTKGHKQTFPDISSNVRGVTLPISEYDVLQLLNIQSLQNVIAFWKNVIKFKTETLNF